MVVFVTCRSNQSLEPTPKVFASEERLGRREVHV